MDKQQGPKIISPDEGQSRSTGGLEATFDEICNALPGCVCWGDPIAPWMVKEIILSAMLKEREACANVCEEEICSCCWPESAQSVGEHLADTIRMRSKP